MNGVELSRVLWRGGLLAGAAWLSVVPYAYRSAYTFSEALERSVRLSPGEVLRADLLSLGALVVLAALVGSGFSRRYQLGGLGPWPFEAGWWRHVGVLAPLFALVSYVSFGRVMAQRLPGTFPSEVPWALAYAVKGAVFDEVVARYGLMTIAAGVVRPAWANVLQALFFTATIWKGLGLFGVKVGFEPYFVASVVSTFGLHLYLGWLYHRRGLGTAMAAHLVYDLRFLLHALVLLAIPGSG